jgi:hypothetical protein
MRAFFSEMKMKSSKAVVVACSLLSTLAYAQVSPQPMNSEPAQLQTDQMNQSPKYHRVRYDEQRSKENSCVGPASFCTTYFGS